MRRAKTLIRLLMLTGAALAVCLSPSAAGGGIAVSPLKQELAVKPGEKATFKINVSNNKRSGTDTAQSARLEVMDVAVTEDGTLQFPKAGTFKNSASQWIRLGATEVTLDPGKSQAVECTITAPATPGEFYSAIIVTLGATGKTEQGLTVVHRIASGVFVTVAGRTMTKEAKVARCELVRGEAPSPGVDSPPQPPKIQALLLNTGLGRFDAAGKVSLADSQSRIVFTTPLVSKRPCVFGGDRRLFEATLDKPLPAGQYVAQVEFDYQSPWAKARSRATVEIAAETAELLKAMQKARQAKDDPPLQLEPARLSLSVPPGAFRSLKLQVKNTAQDAVPCTVSLVAEGDRPIEASWVAVQPPQFDAPKAGSRTLELSVRVPEGAAAGRYAFLVLVEAAGAGGDKVQLRTSLELDVKGEK